MRIPGSTYRLQFNRDFGFKDAGGILEYLYRLGITDIYASPVFKCRKGSTHGYDVTDPNLLNSEAGTEADFNALVKRTANMGMGWLQDIVPNHMAFCYQNEFIRDVMENGPSSQFGEFFDINWNYPYESIRGKLLAPFLGAPYGEALENGEIRLSYGEDGFYAAYYDNFFPIRIESYADILSHDIDGLKSRLGQDSPVPVKLAGIISSLKNMPQDMPAGGRKEQSVFIKNILRESYSGSAEIKEYIDSCLASINGIKGRPESFQALDHILSAQFYRLCYWKSGSDEINYRRFFNVNELISVKQERSEVYEYTHKLILELVRAGKITGIRVDHIDGLFNPNGYLGMLRKDAPETYIAVEKILAFGEKLPHFWPVQGSTGYEFMNYCNGLYCARENLKKFDRIYDKFTGVEHDYRELMLGKKRLIIGKRMAGDVENLARTLKEASARDRHGADMTMYALKRAMVEILALFPVYRTYVEPAIFTEQDRNYITLTLEAAARSVPGLAKEIDFIGKFLLLKFPDYLVDEAEKMEWVNFVMRFQQLTGPLMAKGFEDTFLYVYNRLISLNEVGGFPEKFGIEAREFHEYCINKAESWPGALNATSTHDTKRGEDVRARINVLSEIPHEWEEKLKKWKKFNSKISKGIDGNDEYFLYQTLLGSWPAEESAIPEYEERIKNYAIKAVREAKVHTAWIKPDLNYESAFLNFISKAIERRSGNQFLDDFKPFQAKVSFYGMLNSLSQLLIKIAAPGAPDFYQGSELWDLNLVDPDNRRPVDYAARMKMLNMIAGNEPGTRGMIDGLFRRWQDGGIKMFAMMTLLKIRSLNPEIFEKGNYEPAVLDGPLAGNLVVFIRRNGLNVAIAAAPRFMAGLVKEGELPLGEKIWKDTKLILPPADEYVLHDAFTGAEIKAQKELSIGRLFGLFPGALLTGRKAG